MSKHKKPDPNHFIQMFAALGYTCTDSARATELTTQLEGKMLLISRKAATLSNDTLLAMLKECDDIREQLRSLFVFDQYHNFRPPRVM